MPTLRLSQTIRTPASEVFRTVTDIPGFAEWHPTIKSARWLADGEPAEGARFVFSIRGIGTQELEMTRFETNRSVRFEPRSGMMDGGHLFTLSAEGDVTRVQHELEMRPRGVWKSFLPLMELVAKRDLRLSADALKKRVECAASHS